VLEDGGQGALIGLFLQSGVACIPKYAVLSRGCDEREEAHTSAAGYREVESDVEGSQGFAQAEIAAKPVAEKAPGQPG
jgi:predicted glycosyl hydrolase (DUF1957 family)